VWEEPLSVPGLVAQGARCEILYPRDGASNLGMAEPKCVEAKVACKLCVFQRRRPHHGYQGDATCAKKRVRVTEVLERTVKSCVLRNTA
jgi:hypothetical protein